MEIMHATRRAVLAMAAALLAATVLAACGSEGEEPSEAPPDVADPAAIVLRAGDVPETWETSEDPEEDVSIAELASTCLGRTGVAPAEVAASPNAELDGQLLYTWATSYETEEAAAEAVEAFDDAVAGCMAQEGFMGISEDDPQPLPGASEATVVRFDPEDREYYDVAALQVDSVVAWLLYAGAEDGIDEQVLGDVVAAMRERAEDAEA